MKVGVLTFHRAWNYGAVLQCYALLQFLKKLGHEVVVIDYRQEAIEKGYKVFSLKGTIKSIINPRNHYKDGFIYRFLIWRHFSQFRKRYFNLTKKCDLSTIPQDVDTYVIGSDQLWVPKLTGGQIDFVYFGQFRRKQNSKILGYAISSNKKSLSDIGKDKLQKFSRSFYKISLREPTVASYLEVLLNINIYVDIDPTLLLSKEDWRSIIRQKNNKYKDHSYIAIYHLPGRYSGMSREVFLSKVENIANKNNYDIIDLSTFKYSVNDFVTIICNASLVITSSFHATVFSLIFNRPLMSIELKDGYDARYTDLLKSVGGANMIYGKNFDEVSYREVDYNKISKKLTLLKQPSIKYLQDSI